MDHTITDIYRIFLSHPAVSTDSRRIEPGSVFFALRGESFNGNEYAEKALESGAAYAIVDEPRYVLNASCLLVDDALSTLQALARYHRMQYDIPVIAITGTNGKTTTKELISGVLRKKYTILATRGNLNNHIGVPLTLLEINRETEIAIIEMGANHPGEIAFLCNIARPVCGLITNIGKAHLEGFGSYEGVVSTKTELYRYLNEHDGLAFVNNEDQVLTDHAAGLEHITYGIAPASLSAGNVSADPFVAMDLQFSDGACSRLESKLYGRYNAGNILAAACVGQYFQVPPVAIKSAIEAYQPRNNRSQIVKTDCNLLILDAYNANPGSMKAAIQAFAESSFTEKSVILGDMLELGTESDKEHADIMEMVDRMSFKHVYLVGPVFTRLNTSRNNTCFQDSSLARIWFEHHKVENATILIKGSRGIRLENIAEVL